MAGRPLLLGAYSLAANTLIGSALGFGFWVAAARLFAPSDLGRDTVLVSAMIELSTLCQLNLGNAILRFGPGLGRRAPRALLRAYLVATAAALVVGAAFVLLAPALSSEFAFLGEGRGLALLFVVGLACWGVFVLQDAALTAARRAAWIPVENGVFGLLKIAALALAALLSLRHGIFLAWVASTALLLAPVNWLIFRRALPRRIAEPPARTRPTDEDLRGFLARDYLAGVFTQATLTSLPILVLVSLGAQASAWFAVPFTIAVAYDTLAYGTTAALVAEASLEGEDAGDLARLFARRILAPLVPVTLLLIALAPLILGLFGSSYSSHGTTVLRLLLAACLLRLGLALFAALCRVGGRAGPIAAIELALLVVSLGAAVPLARANGIVGVATAWLGANLLASIWASRPLLAELRA